MLKKSINLFIAKTFVIHKNEDVLTIKIHPQSITFDLNHEILDYKRRHYSNN